MTWPYKSSWPSVIACSALLVSCAPVETIQVKDRLALLAAIDMHAECGANLTNYEKIQESRVYSLWRGLTVSNSVNQYLLVGDPFRCPISFLSFNGALGIRVVDGETSSVTRESTIDVAPYLVIQEEIRLNDGRSAEDVFLSDDPEELVRTLPNSACYYPTDFLNENPSAAQKIIYVLNTTAELWLVPPDPRIGGGGPFTFGCGRIYLNGELVL